MLMKTAKFKTKNTLYEINEDGIHRNGELMIKSECIKNYNYYGVPEATTLEPQTGAKLCVVYYDPEEDAIMSMDTTRIQEVF